MQRARHFRDVRVRRFSDRPAWRVRAQSLLVRACVVMALVAVDVDKTDAQSLTPSSPGDIALKKLMMESDPDELSELLRETFQNLTDESLARYKLYPNVSFSLFAAWEQARRRCERAAAASDEEAAEAETYRSLAAFVGFVEGRLGITPPPWWRTLIERAEPVVISSDSALGEKRVVEFSYPAFELGCYPVDPKIWASNGVRVARDAQRVKITTEAFSISPSSDYFQMIVDDLTASQCVVDALVFDDESVLIIIHDVTAGGGLAVARLHKDPQAVLWTKRVKPVVPMGGFSGTGPWHRTTASVVQGDKVALFGAGPFVAYIVVLDGVHGSVETVFFSEGWFGEW